MSVSSDNESPLRSIPEESSSVEDTDVPFSSLQNKRGKVVDELNDFISRNNSRFPEEDTEEEQQKKRDVVRVGKFLIEVIDKDEVMHVHNDKSGYYFYIRLGNKKA